LIPAELAHAKKLQMKVNGQSQEFRLPQSSIEVLLRWHARDFDRSQLYAKQIEIEVTGEAGGTCR